MKTWILLAAFTAGLALLAVPGVAQDRNEAPRPSDAPAKDAPSSQPSASPASGGDTKPSAVDPAQSTTTGANPGEGASYNRSSEKGQSVMPKEDADKSR